jgi:hypothetical protein
MAAAAMLEIEVHGIEWAIITDFDENRYTDLEKHSELKSHKSGSDRPPS